MFFQVPTSTPKYVKSNSYTNRTIERIRSDLIAENIPLKMDASLDVNPNIAYNIIESSVSRVKHRHLPIKMVKFKRYKHELNNWIKFRDKLYKQLKVTKVNTPEYLGLEINLVNYIKILKRTLRNAKQRHC